MGWCEPTVKIVTNTDGDKDMKYIYLVFYYYYYFFFFGAAPLHTLAIIGKLLY